MPRRSRTTWHHRARFGLVAGAVLLGLAIVAGLLTYSTPDLPLSLRASSLDGWKYIDFGLNSNVPATNPQPNLPKPPPAVCNDKKDNDADGFTDFPKDPGCVSATDTSEQKPWIACDDGKDNDGDGGIDVRIRGGGDSNCRSPLGQSEDSSVCNDGSDNDKDGKIDFPDDVGCSNLQDMNEQGANACDDGRDNDVDGTVDTRDPGCTDAADTSEKGRLLCDDGEDNDGDSKKDFQVNGGGDPDCTSLYAPTESSGKQCKDGIDNDGDKRSDFGQDPGCDSADDPLEKGSPICDNGIDDDSDGGTDYFITIGRGDFACSTPEGTSEDIETGYPCDDGRDNDGDGRVDFQIGGYGDAGCTGVGDQSEALEEFTTYNTGSAFFCSTATQRAQNQQETTLAPAIKQCRERGGTLRQYPGCAEETIRGFSVCTVSRTCRVGCDPPNP